MTDVSVLTIVRGRHGHLAALIAGLNRQTQPPAELVIAYMQDHPHAGLPAAQFPVRTVMVPGEPMPLARARNAAAAVATGELLIFLDVDCLPSPTLVESYAAAADCGGVMLGEVVYLPANAVTDPLDFAALDRVGRRHPAKPAPPENGLRGEPDHGELWGLSFALAAAMWREVGGMDAAFTGYGAEETDFGAKLAARGVPLLWLGAARAYHQHHPVHVPPLQHFAHIVRNAELFRAKWGRWCMDYWLDDFAARGFIRRDATTIEVLRVPTPAEVAAARMADDVLFS